MGVHNEGRREFLKRSTVAAASVWALPSIHSLAVGTLAAGSSPPEEGGGGGGNESGPPPAIVENPPFTG